jgi:hypothetical protein
MFLIGFWAAVFSALLGVWQSLPYLFADFLALRRGSGAAVWAEGSVERSRPYRFYLTGMATVPLLLVRWPVEHLQLAFGVTGAMLLPLLALTLLVMNNRVDWVGREFRTGAFLNLVLGSALLFFTFVGGREIVQMLRPLLAE